MEEFKDGKYALYSGDEVLGELIINDNAISYPSDEDKHSIGDMFPAGEINKYTQSQLHKYLHNHHGYLHLQLEDLSSK